MARQIKTTELKEQVIKAKDHDERKFNHLTDNFYLIRAALRYYSVKKGMSITSSRIAENFPMTIPVAGSSLSVLETMGVIEPRNETSSKTRYLPKGVDMDRLEKLKEILVENYEIEEF